LNIIKKPVISTLVCLLFLAGATAYGKKQDATVAANQSPQPPSQNSAPAAQPPASPLAGWQKFSSAEGKFSVLLPGPPKEKQQTAEIKGGKVELHAFAAEKDIHDGYGAAYYDVPKVSDPGLFLAKLETLIVGTEGKVVFFKRMQIENYPATEFEFVAGGKANYSARTRIILVGQRAYALTVTFLTTEPHPDERDAFFESFSLQQN
jgi:hypothetical protein